MCRKIRPVDISAALAMLPGMTFHDTGGTNGWLADPAPLAGFVAGLGLAGAVLRTNVRKLPAGQGIPPHVDPKVHQSAKVREHRYHVPLVTHPAVAMRWPDEGVAVHLEAGWLYEVRVDKLHEVVHRAPTDRVHVVIDTGEAAC